MEPTTPNVPTNFSNTTQSGFKPPIKPKTGCLGTTMILTFVFVLLLIMGIPACNSYNGMVTREETYSKTWAEVQNVYQRRTDLILNLVETVKGYATHEKGTFVEVTEARAKATSNFKLDANKMDSAQLAKFQDAQAQLTSAYNNLKTDLKVIVERYPELKANENFKQLQTTLETTENDIVTMRTAFNAAAKDYNIYIRKFPKNIFAWMFGFKNKAYFTAIEGAEKPPKVKF